MKLRSSGTRELAALIVVAGAGFETTPIPASVADPATWVLAGLLQIGAVIELALAEPAGAAHLGAGRAHPLRAHRDRRERRLIAADRR